MKKVIILMVLGSLLFVNISLMGMPMQRASAQTDWNTIIKTIVTIISSFVSDGGEDENGYKKEDYIGKKDCHDEILYYYKNELDTTNNTIIERYVGMKEIKLGKIICKPPKDTDFDFYKQVHYKRNSDYERIICNGEATTSCSPRFSTCEEQNP